MEIYIVGGAVRDTLLGREPKDRDFVVVGATPQEMLDQGFVQVGADFPVFLHPKTNEEYALARTERKSGQGYNGFAVNTRNVSLAEDLARRDLTINSMAMTETGDILDLFGGKDDLKAKILRHTTPAFLEDPLRLMRVARFLARFGPQWRVCPGTLSLLQYMVDNGDIDHLTPERVWVEFRKGLMEAHPELMLKLLLELKVFDRPPFAEYRGVFNARFEELQVAAQRNMPLHVRFALAFARIWDNQEAKASRIPSEVREVGHCVQLCLDAGIHQFDERPAEDKLALIEKLDAVRQGERFKQVLEVLEGLHYVQAMLLKECVKALAGLNNAEIIGDLKNGKEIQQRIRAARLQLLGGSAAF